MSWVILQGIVSAIHPHHQRNTRCPKNLWYYHKMEWNQVYFFSFFSFFFVVVCMFTLSTMNTFREINIFPNTIKMQIKFYHVSVPYTIQYINISQNEYYHWFQWDYGHEHSGLLRTLRKVMGQTFKTVFLIIIIISDATVSVIYSFNMQGQIPRLFKHLHQVGSLTLKNVS